VPVWCKSLARSLMTFAQLLAIGALSVACSGGSDEPGSSTSMTVGQFCQESAELICANLAGCCSLSVEDCVEAHRSGCEESGGNATSRGLSFDAAAAQRCAAASRGLYASCEVPSPVLSTTANGCGLVYRPTLASGASCTFDAACQAAEGLAGVCSSGACTQVPLLADGAPCGDAVAGTCSAAAYCDETCRPRKGSGQSCAGALECASGWCESGSCGTRPISTICAALTDSK
jgi:hypothetical protein